MNLRGQKLANPVGLVSLVLAVVPVVYVFHADLFLNHGLTEAVVLIGGIGGALLLALAAGILGSRWWLLALLGTAIDVVVVIGFSP